MKIGIDIRTLMDENWSGVSGYTYNLVRKILEVDRSREYRLFYNSGRDISSRIPEFNADNARVVRTRHPNKIFNYFMQKTLGRPKIDRLLGVDRFISPHINFLSLSDRCRKIITVHDLSFLRYPEFFSLRKNIWHRALNVKKMLKGFDMIAAVSENTKRDIIELCGIDEARIRVIYPGISRRYQPLDRTEKREEFEAARKKYALPRNYILYVGNLEPRKNVPGLIRAYGIFRDANGGSKDMKLVIAGAKGWKSEDIFREWRESKYRQDIKFIGYVDEEDKVYIYNLAALFVYPSFYEGFGFPPLEAAACGVPVIAGSNSSLPEVVGQEALLVDSGNIAEIAGAISVVLKSGHPASFPATKSGKSQQRFSWENTAKGYLEILD
ncbi:MAG: glycosyltransferase family 1 protein [Candidatus Falkowbacteria bacterium]